ncbi:hypothetical protein B0O99DRAFT_551988 [Bisporella sp. PMI_857]|nr:hypothetical protein B0O99DRAFT_551988 [Bisporella sp. PMI_857]
MASFSPEYLAENRGPVIMANNAIITGIAAIIVVVRLGSRFAILKKLGLDDWSILLATIFAVANIVVASQSIRLGTGRHVQAVPKKNAIPAGIYRFVTRVVYFCITGTIKLSVCFLYLRVFATIRTPTLILISVIVAASIAQIICTVFQCVPVAAVWDAASYPNAVCINNVAFSYAAAALSVVTDIWALVLPIPTIWNLQMATRKKITLVALLMIGLFACIAGIIRMAFLITLLTSKDPTWDTYGTSIASGWETALAIICACVPGLKPMFDRIFPRLFPTTQAKSSNLGYELGTGGNPTSKGFTEIGTDNNRSKDRDGGDSTRAIKVDYEYMVRSDASS